MCLDILMYQTFICFINMKTNFTHPQIIKKKKKLLKHDFYVTKLKIYIPHKKFIFKFLKQDKIIDCSTKYCKESSGF